MGKKNKKSKKDVVRIDPIVEDAVILPDDYGLDCGIADIVQNLRERMAETAANTDMSFSVFIEACVQIGSRAVTLARDVDRLQETLDMLKMGMNPSRRPEPGNGHQAETEVPGSADRS